LTQMPDLGKPYTSDGERVSDRERLILFWYAIEALTRLAELPAPQWSSDQIGLFPTSVPGGPSEHPQRRLQRWLLLYKEEINAIRDIRNRLVHTRDVTDAELRGAAWLANQVLATATGRLPSEIDQRLVRDVVARSS
jgi:hypothetical protein